MKLFPVVVVGVALLAAAACVSGEDESLTADADSLCAKQCTCSGFCSEDDLSACEEEDEDLKTQAQSKGCGDQLKGYLGCVEDLECKDGEVDDSGCSSEYSAMNACIHPKPTCATAKNGACDEPEGTATCPEGSDPDDCGAPPCASTNNGVCDEPDVGTGMCPAGTDVADCAPPCETTNNGVCDEPEGSNTCAEGADVNDCIGPCVSCAVYLMEGAGTLCPASQPVYDALEQCVCVSECPAECTVSTCPDMEAGAACAQCINTYCSSPYNACVNDT